MVELKWHQKAALTVGVSLLLLGWVSPAWAQFLTVVTNDATNIGATSATLNGELTDTGGFSPLQVSFQWGTTTAYGNETSPQPKTAAGNFSAAISGLNANTTYHFRAKAVGDSTTVYGADKAFIYFDLKSWGWCPDYRGIGDVTLSGGAILIVRADNPEVSDVYFNGTFTFTVPGQSDSLPLTLSGTKVRSLFSLGEQNAPQRGSFRGLWLEESDPDYISGSGHVEQAPGTLVTTVRYYWFVLKTDEATVPERSVGGYVEDLEFIISRVGTYFDQLVDDLFTRTDFKEALELVLAKVVKLFEEMRNLLTPYIP